MEQDYRIHCLYNTKLINGYVSKSMQAKPIVLNM